MPFLKAQSGDPVVCRMHCGRLSLMRELMPGVIAVFAVILGRSSTKSASLDPDDSDSAYFDHTGEHSGAGDANARETTPPAPTIEAQPS